MNSLISSNTLFHFTKSIKNLKSILENDFYPQFCYEDIAGSLFKSTYIRELAVPMVCFCDIPLSQTQKHTKTYGEYGLGMSKEWAIKKKINPILYSYADSDLGNKLAKVMIEISNLNSDVDKEALLDEFISVLLYLKQYEGSIWKNGRWKKGKIRFYDEREWRFVQRLPSDDSPIYTIKKDKKTNYPPQELRDFNKVIREHKELRLSFEPNDIKYIIVKKENEILDMIDSVTKIKRDKFTHKDTQILTTRIISMENIKENF